MHVFSCVGLAKKKEENKAKANFRENKADFIGF